MQKRKKRIWKWLMAAFFVTLILGFFSLQPKEAFSELNIISTPTSVSYELADKSGYSYAGTADTEKFSYGASSAGRLEILGGLGGRSFRGLQAFGVQDTASFRYEYTNSVLQENDVDKWIVLDSRDKTVSGITLPEKMGKGAFIVQKSSNRAAWTTETILTNVLNDTGANLIYTPLAADLSVGVYYRIILAYEIQHRTGKALGFLWPTYEYRECVEVWEFYLCYDSAQVTVKDFITREEIVNGAETDYGFIVDKNQSQNVVNVAYENGEKKIVEYGASFYEPGVYTVYETTKLGWTYTTEVKVSIGLSTEEAPVSSYESEDNTGYLVGESTKTSYPCFGDLSYTTLKIAVSKDGKVEKDTYENNVFGVAGALVGVTFRVNPNRLGDWENSKDSWGTIENETVDGIKTGPIESGALIVQKSDDGNNWKLTENSIYENGVFTTDFETSFGTGGEVPVYFPSGEDILKGTYYRILYAYEIYNPNENLFRNVVEEYRFRLCSDNLGAIVFHNLSLEEKTEEDLGGEEALFVEISKRAETLMDGSETVSGFAIDISLNPTVFISLKRNGIAYAMPEDGKVTEDGRYDILITSALHHEKELTIFVNKKTAKELYNAYFGEKFLSGKRIFSKGDYPVYEGGLIYYNIQSIGENLPCLYGTIENETGEKIEIAPTREAKTGTIIEAGEYVARFSTNATFATETPSGDNHVLTFSFNVIANGTAPGPQVNKEALEKYSGIKTPTNSRSVYYGVTYQSARKGFITLAFATEQSAYQYAYNYEKGMVEVQADGSFRYMGTLVVSQKIKYESSWDLTDAVHYFAQAAVQRLYFDLSDVFTYTTLSEEVLSSTENLRTLELNNSVVVFANEEEAAALLKNTGLPLLNSKKYAYSIPGVEGGVEQGKAHFEFVKDEQGYDSAFVTVIDKNGDRYEMKYRQSVEEQLVAFGCPTGIVTIEEKTIYGDKTEYQAVFIAEGENTTTVNLNYYVEKEQNVKKVSSAEQGFSVTVSAFYFSDLKDELDPYGFIKITRETEEEFFCLSEKVDKVWTEAGDYQITLTNRLGYSYSFNLKIEETYYSVAFSGEGADGLEPILYVDGDVISLPKLTRYGYEHIGYKSSSGQVYSDEVAAILLKGQAVLEVVWKAKQFRMNFYVDDALYKSQTVDFGETYGLPTLESTPTRRFVGWSRDGKNFVNSWQMTEEGDVILRAYFEMVEEEIPEEGDGPISPDGPTNPNEPNTPNQPVEPTPPQDVEQPQEDGDFWDKVWWVWLLIAILLILAIVFFIAMCYQFYYGEWLGVLFLILTIVCGGGVYLLLIFL